MLKISQAPALSVFCFFLKLLYLVWTYFQFKLV